MDEWDLLNEVDVIALWPGEHKKNVESSKWQERKEALEVLSQLIEKNPRLSTASMTIYGELMDNLRKIIAFDSNINVVVAALQVITNLAKGLRDRFGCYVSMVWTVMLDKSKDKKANVRAALGEALDAVSDTCAAERLGKDLVEHLTKPNPQSKQCLCMFISRYLVRQTTIPMEFLKTVLPIVVKLASDSDPSVRDSACNALGSARRVMGKNLDAFLSPIISEKAKLDKIDEYCSEAIKRHTEYIASRPQRSGLTVCTAEDAVECSSGEAETVQSSSSKDKDPWTLLEPSDVVKKLRNDFDELIISKKWQERKEAVDNFLAVVECTPRVGMTPELQQLMAALIKVIEKDVNINVSSISAKVLAELAIRMRTEFAVMVPKVMPVVFDKLKEKKAVLRNELVALSNAAALTSCLENYADAVCGGLTKQNPQSRGQTALFVARLLSQHDSTTVPLEALKQIIPDLVKCSFDADAEVRESTFRAMAAVLRCLGDTAARRLFGEISEDKLKMGKITEYLGKIREEFGEKASPEILRLYSGVVKPKLASSSCEAKNVAQRSRNAQAARAPTRPVTASSRPTTASSRSINRTPAQSTTAPRRPNVVNTTTDRRGAPARAPLTTRPTQQVTSNHNTPTVSARITPGSVTTRAPTRTVHAPNVVRGPTNAGRPTVMGPVRVPNSASNGSLPTSVTSTPAPKKSALPRSNSGLRPPTAVVRTGGVLRLSRPPSPAK